MWRLAKTARQIDCNYMQLIAVHLAFHIGHSRIFQSCFCLAFSSVTFEFRPSRVFHSCVFSRPRRAYGNSRTGSEGLQIDIDRTELRKRMCRGAMYVTFESCVKTAKRVINLYAMRQKHHTGFSDGTSPRVSTASPQVKARKQTIFDQNRYDTNI